ncbi:hypothetical protein [Spirosoma fluminis]
MSQQRLKEWRSKTIQRRMRLVKITQQEKNDMDKAQKFELMNKVVRELEDLQNSQTALMTKIGQIEVDNMNGLNDKRLEDDLGDMHSKIAQNVDAITEIFAYFEQQRDEFGNANRSAIEAAEAAAAVDAAK